MSHTTTSKAIYLRDIPIASLTTTSEATLVARSPGEVPNTARVRYQTADDHPTGPPTTATAATADARVRFTRSHVRACSSPLSKPLSVSQKGQSSRHWTEPVIVGEAQTA